MYNEVIKMPIFLVDAFRQSYLVLSELDWTLADPTGKTGDQSLVQFGSIKKPEI